MGEKDFIGDPVKYSFSGVVPIDDLYKAMFKWAKAYGYKIIEKEHKTLAMLDKKEYAFTWVFEKKTTDYVKFNIDTDVKAKNLREVKVKEGKKKYYQGEISFSFSAYLNKDYEGAHGRNPVVKFTREVFDKYVSEGKMSRLAREIENERDSLIKEIKAFLEVQRLKNKEEKK